MQHRNFSRLSSSKELIFKDSKILQNLLSIPIYQYDNVIIDVGDVILFWNSEHQVAGRQNVFDLRQVLRHPLWKDFEIGKLNETLAYTQLSSEFGVSVQEIVQVLSLSRQSIKIDAELVSFLKKLKKLGKRVVCLSNMDHNSFQHLFSDYSFWSIFDTIYVSSLLSMRKPEQTIFELVLEHSSFEASRTIYIDNDDRNLTIANKLGLRGIGLTARKFLYREVESIEENNLENKLDVTKAERAYSYLIKSLRKHLMCPTFSGEGLEIANTKPFCAEIFSTIVVLNICPFLPKDVTNTLLQSVEVHGNCDLRWCFYTKAIRPEGFPDDLDTTSMALSILIKAGKIKTNQLTSVINDMLANRDLLGKIQVYFCDERPRIDAVVCLNILYLFAQLGMADRSELKQTKAYVQEFLKSGEYHLGTRYYPSPETFLYFLWRLVHHYSEHFGYLKCDLKRELIARVNSTSHPIERAMRVISLGKMGVVNRIDYMHLLNSQLSDGGWPMGALFIAFKDQIYFGSRELTTAFALEAISVMNTQLIPINSLCFNPSADILIH